MNVVPGTVFATPQFLGHYHPSSKAWGGETRKGVHPVSLAVYVRQVNSSEELITVVKRFIVQAPVTTVTYVLANYQEIFLKPLLKKSILFLSSGDENHEIVKKNLKNGQFNKAWSHFYRWKIHGFLH